MTNETLATPNIYIKKSGSIGLQEIDPDRILEADFLRLLLLFGESRPQFLAMAERNLAPSQLRTPICQRFYEAYGARAQAGQSRDMLGLIIQLQDEEGSAFVTELLHKKVNKEKAEAAFMGEHPENSRSQLDAKARGD